LVVPSRIQGKVKFTGLVQLAPGSFACLGYRKSHHGPDRLFSRAPAAEKNGQN
jgi:hypothetical protein